MAHTLTGTQYEIAAGDYQATVTELGAGLRQLSRGQHQLITSYGADELPPAGAGQLLAPWPNRVDGGRYTFGGSSHQLDLSEPAHGNAIHGLTRWASWRVTAHTVDTVELAMDLLGHAGYPFCLQLRASFRLTAEAGLEMTVTADNAGSHPAPFGIGSHPYLRAGSGSVDSWQLQLPATRWQPADERGIPSGAPLDVAGSEYDFRAGRAIGATVLDHAFTGLSTGANGRAMAVLTGPDAQITLWGGAGYSWLQVFTGDTLGPDARRRAVAIEPMTCPPNAFVTGTDLLSLEPGASVRYQWGISAAIR
ncbi:MAG: aldose 1-epimerase family protein [Actinobacteria bacterium]|nr:aldose 1-epimerase family protein [Actinomycetota bacterium]